MDDFRDADQLRQALVSYRKQHDLTREEFAEKSGFSKWWVEKFEQGAIVEPKLSRARELAQFLDAA